MKKIISLLLMFAVICQMLCSCGEAERSVTESVEKGSVSEPDAEESATDTIHETDFVYDIFDETYFEEELPKSEETTAGYNRVYQMNYMSLNMNNIMQEEYGLPYGCEVVSLAIALEYYGHPVDPRILFRGFMPNDVYGKANPYHQYIGDPSDSTGYGCYAPCVVETANTYLERRGSKFKARDISGSSMYDLLGYIWSGYPVIIWGTLDMVPTSRVIDSWYFDGQKVNWYAHSHCVVICGVQDDNFIICDPMVGKVRYPIKDVEAAYNLIYSQAVVIY